MFDKNECIINRLLHNQPEIILNWNDVLEISGKTTATRKEYLYTILDFMKFLKNNEKLDNLSRLKTINIIHYFKYKENGNNNRKKISDSYKVHIWYVLNNFINYLNSIDIVDKNYMIGIPKTKIRDIDYEKHEKLTADNFSTILKTIKIPKRMAYFKVGKNKNTQARDTAIVLLLMTTGMRKTALTEINIQNLDLNNATLFVIDKGRKTYKYYLQETVITALQEWLSDREWLLMMTDKNTNALFLNQKGDRITGRGIDNIINKYSKRALGHELYPHTIRSGFCSIIYSQTHDIEFVRRAVGHANVATTQRYIVTDKSERKQSADIMERVLKIAKPVES